MANALSPNKTDIGKNNISFRNIRSKRINNLLRIDFEIWHGGLSAPDEIFYELDPAPEFVSEDILALSFATLCGRKYDLIEMALTVSSGVVAQIRSFTGAKISCKSVTAVEKSNCRNGGGTAISFSGGIDSLALKEVLPNDVELISMNFMDGFEREAKFFTRFNPRVVRTNFRNKGYANNSWTFMGVGVLLYSQALNLKNCCFGTILEAAALNFIHGGSPHEIAYDVFAAAGMDCPLLVKGLTEVGTAMVVMKYHSELYPAALTSLADPGSAKWYRKYLLGKRAAEIYGKDFEVESGTSYRRDGWGLNFATDFLTLYFLKHFGLEVVNRLCKGLPSDACDFVKNMRLTFYERVNPDYLNILPKASRTGVVAKLDGADILCYDSTDWREFDEVRKYLYSYYPRNAKGLDLKYDNLHSTATATGLGRDSACGNFVHYCKKVEKYTLRPQGRDYSYMVLSDAMVPGGRYRIDIERLRSYPKEVEVEGVDVVVFDVRRSKCMATYNFTCSLDRQSVVVDIPKQDSCYQLILYAGKRGKCNGVGLEISGICITREYF